MTEEIERLKSDLKHTSSARARAERRDDEVRSSLTMAEGELREVQGELQVTQNDLVETREGLQSAQGELQLVREELITSRGEQRDLQAELRAVTTMEVYIDDMLVKSTTVGLHVAHLSEAFQILRNYNMKLNPA